MKAGEKGKRLPHYTVLHLGPAPHTHTHTQQADSRAYTVSPSGMISHPSRTKMPLSLREGASTAGTFWVLFIQISVCGEGRAEQNRMLPTGADLSLDCSAGLEQAPSPC